MITLKHGAAMLMAAFVVGLAAAGAPAGVDLLGKVKDAIRKAEAEGIPPKDDQAGLPYDETHMAAILIAAGDYFSKPAAQALRAVLQFKPEYHDTGAQTRIVRRAPRRHPRHRQLGDEYVTVEIRRTNTQSAVKGYRISGGDVASLREIQLVCSALNQAIKDTPLDTQKARRYSPALKNLHTLLTDLPKFAARYFEVEGSGPQKHDVRLAEVETRRKELLGVYQDWLAELAAVKKAGRQTTDDGRLTADS